MSERSEPDLVTCPGHCCERLVLHPEMESLERSAMCGHAENSYIAQMLVPIDVPDEPQVWYTCRLFDRTTRLCTQYESRPTMCHVYPGDSPCRWCSYDPKTSACGTKRPEIPAELVPTEMLPPSVIADDRPLPRATP